MCGAKSFVMTASGLTLSTGAIDRFATADCARRRKSPLSTLLRHSRPTRTRVVEIA